MLYIYCDRPSKSFYQLSSKLKAKRVRKDIIGNPDKDIIINWGSSNLIVNDETDEKWKHKLLNKPFAVNKSSNKLTFFDSLKTLKLDKLAVPFTTDKNVAEDWIRKGYSVVCRTKLRSHSGDGIVIARASNELVEASLYTRYIPKETEWRVHVFNGQVIDIQRKARNKNIPDDKVNWNIRNHDNGFIYVRGDIKNYSLDIIAHLTTVSVGIVKALDLDFGAVDLIVDKKGWVYALEVNTAPGLEGTTMDNYVVAIKDYIKEKKETLR